MYNGGRALYLASNMVGLAVFRLCPEQWLVVDAGFVKVVDVEKHGILRVMEQALEEEECDAQSFALWG